MGEIDRNRSVISQYGGISFLKYGITFAILSLSGNKNPVVLTILRVIVCIRLKLIFILSNGPCKIVIKTNIFSANAAQQILC